MNKQSTARLRVESLKKAVGFYYVKKRYAVNFEIGLDKRGRFRADVLAMTIHGYLVIVETKQSVQDFKTDLKWHNYQQYCNKFYFAFLPDTWSKVKTLIPKGIGVMVLSEASGRMKVLRKAHHHELPKGNQKKLVLRMAYRGAVMSRYNTKRTYPIRLKEE